MKTKKKTNKAVATPTKHFKMGGILDIEPGETEEQARARQRK